MDVSYPNDSYPDSDNSYPLLVGSYPTKLELSKPPKFVYWLRLGKPELKVFP